MTSNDRQALQAVIVDTETTGLQLSDEIVQVAAKLGDKRFTVHMTPSMPFAPEASNLTKLYLSNGKLVKWKKREKEFEEVKTVSREEGAKRFIDFLRQCGSKLLLVGHNILTFDAPRILKWLSEFALQDELIEITYGFTDTFLLLKRGDMCGLLDLAKTFLTAPGWKDIIVDGHDAMADCEILCGLLEHFRLNVSVLAEKAVTTEKFIEWEKAAQRKAENLLKLKGLENFIRDEMVGKMAIQGISTEELKVALSHGRAALEECLGREVNGKPRVTKSPKVVDKVVQFIKSVP